jgi:IS1 family transposase
VKGNRLNILSTEQRAAVIRALVEGNSLRAAARMTDVARNTVAKLLVDLGQVCSAYQDATMRDLPCTRIQCDEIWSFCHNKEKNTAPEHEGQFGYGDVWTWTAIDADSKLVPSWLVGDRDTETAMIFMDDLRSRLANRVQLTTDGHKPYLVAVYDAFGSEIDYAVLIKIYGKEAGDEKRYSPPTCIGTEINVMTGEPDPAHISTSYVERQNLTMRMSMRRFTRLTNAFSKKVENLAAAVSLHFLYYNFARPHMALMEQTPAMKAGIADHQWTVTEIAALLDAPAQCGSN